MVFSNGIKRISVEAFLYLKELLSNLRRPKIKSPRKLYKKPPIAHKTAKIIVDNGTPMYEPSGIGNAYDSTFWQWRRVAAWEHYINDPLENKSGHR